MRFNILASSVVTSILMASPVLGQAKQAVPGPSSSWGGIVPMMLVMFAIIYFLMIRPEQKKQKDRLNMVNSIKKGDKVVSIGGIMGVVHNIKDTTIFVKIAENTVVEFTKAAISTVVKEGSEKAADEKKVIAEESKDSKEKKK
jgi:preprotein translocase subunit YajC